MLKDPPGKAKRNESGGKSIPLSHDGKGHWAARLPRFRSAE